MTPCEEFLRGHIKSHGPISIARFIQTCLSHPEFGYYATQDRFGKAGDFITAPEISQLFGEMMAGALSALWHYSGQPDSEHMCRLEAGPGRGTLYQDMHKTYRHICPPLSTAAPYFIEASPFLQERIRALSKPLHAQFIEDLTALPEMPIFGIANEFFDALGVNQACFHNGRWVWRALDWQQDSFTFIPHVTLSPDELASLPLPHQPAEGEIFEISPLSEKIMRALSSHIAQFGGAFFICDYGKSDNCGDSLQAVRAHKKAEILENLGQTDISHLVDFSALSRKAKEMGARLIGPVEQGAFLNELGIKERAEALRQKGQPETDRQLLAALDRLTSPQHMGQLFKVALLVPDGSGYPPGFATAA